jgi:hypothetical protein
MAYGSATNVTIAELAVNRAYGNVVFVRLTAAPSTPASCSTNGYWHFTVVLDDVGKSMYAELLAAFSRGGTITIAGTNACSEIGSVESTAAVNTTS